MKQLMSKIIQKSLKELDINLDLNEIQSHLETPPSADMGDYSFPCFFLASKLNDSPHRIALQLREKIKKVPKEISDIQTAGAYLNFFLDKKNQSLNLIQEILSQGDNYGKVDLGNNQKVVIEHTSINPNASPHVGRIRNALIGDSIVQLYKFFNFNPEVHYYVNDVSKQIAMLVLADAQKLKFNQMLKKYSEISKKVSKSKKLEKQVFELLNKFENQDKNVVSNFKKVVSTCIKGQKNILSLLGINYDSFDYESVFIPDSKKILNNLQKTKKLFKDKKNRFVLDLTGTSVQNKMKSPVLVLTRNDGTGLYPLRDIAYTKYKLGLSKNNVLVLGEDQKLYFMQISEALKLLNLPSPISIHYSFILLNEKGKSKKMSTRKGDVVLVEDFLSKAIQKAKREIQKRKTKGNPEKVAIASVKYGILKNATNKIINFNLEEALNFEGNTGSYILYTYARASSVNKKIKKIKKISKFKELNSKEEKLIKNLSLFKEISMKSFETLNPSLIANYSYELAKSFNEFYEESRIINSENEFFRINLLNSFRQVLKNSMSLLGIELIEKM